MGTTYEDSRALLVVADLANADASGKLNIIGGAFALAGFQGGGVAFSVVACVDLPSSHAGEQIALALELVDDSTGSVVVLTDADGGSQPVRISQLADVARPQIPGRATPAGVNSRVQVVINFPPPGIPLPPDRSYSWRLTIDGHHRPDWVAQFYVLGDPPPPVFGGPMGAADIPNINLG